MTRLKQAWLALCGLLSGGYERCTRGGVALADPDRLCQLIAEKYCKNKAAQTAEGGEG